MLGLILKDFYNVRKVALWYVAMIALFCLLSVMLEDVIYGSAIGMLVTAAIPMTAVSYEERDGWQKFAVACGMDRRIIVLEKYLLGVIFAAISSLCYLAVYLIVDGAENTVFNYVMPVCMQYIALSAIMPLIYKFGVEKGRAYFIAALLALMVLFIALMTFLSPLMAGADGELAAIIVLSVLTPAILVASYFVSCAVYRNKKL